MQQQAQEARRRTWVEIDLDAIRENYRISRQFLKDSTGMIAVVKANAYGSGAPQVARLLEEEEGVTAFGVASFDEGERLRRAGIEKPVLILGYTPPYLAASLAALSLTVTVTSLAYAKELSAAATAASVELSVHVKVDTGMNRLGLAALPTDEAAWEVAAIGRLPGLSATGIFTHFAASNWADGDFTARQFAAFSALLQALDERGCRPPLAHCCNSAALVFHPECELTCVRSGFLLYGYQPDPDRPVAGIRFPMQMKSLVAQVKTVPPGGLVGYDCTYEARASLRLAVVPVGYADGLPYGLSNRGAMLVKGARAPIVGKVCMDQTMLDVTHIPDVREGDVVTIFGEDGTAALPVTELAQTAGVFAPGFFCNVNARVPRLFSRGGEVVECEVPLTRW
ncbi:MAG: alanine racemase [Clostridia bacterium]|nr:alanine racemase [Clostridia bacterium]